MSRTFAETEAWQNEWEFEDAPSKAGGEKEEEIVIPKKMVFTLIGVVVFLFLLFTGMLSRGYESRTISSSGLVTTSSGGTTIGSKYVFLRAGQTFVVDYDADIQRGGLYMRFRKRTLNFGGSALDTHHVWKSGKGQFRVTAPETGMYRFRVRGTGRGNGYACSYTLYWRAE